jgi:hypothetical protein
MDVIYTVVPIGGMVEHSHPPVATRVARERLAAIMEETFLHHRYITSYTVIGDREFPYPFEVPDILKTQAFFATEDLNAIKRELAYLYTESVREKWEAYLAASEAAKTASDEEMLALYDKYHYTDARQRRYYSEALETVEKQWGAWEEVKSDIMGSGYNGRRSDLTRALAHLDDCLARAFFDDREKFEALLAAGQRDEAAKRIESLAHDWCRKHVSKFENCCGDEKFYGAGYWLARMVLNPEWVAEDTNTWGGKEPDVEQVLGNWEMPYFRVPGDIIARGTTEDSAVAPA